jgi:Ca-activated chloride channel family protein
VSRSLRLQVTWVLLLLVWSGSAPSARAQGERKRRGFSIVITEPENQAVVFGTTRIAAEVEISVPELLDRVEFLVGDDVIFVDREPPFECLHDFGGDSRSQVVRAIAYHKEEVTVTDAVITRKIPYVTIEQVNQVILWVSATDKQGNYLTDLEREQFEVFEDGAKQEILEFYREDRPITMAILLDSSGSMVDKLREVHKAAAAFVETLRPEDQALIIDFDDKVFLIQDLTSDHEALTEALTSTEAIGGTAIYDVLHAAYRKIGSLPGRKAIVLLSDGEDTASQFGFKRILQEAKSNNTLIYSIGLGGGIGGGPHRSVLNDFSDVTGGRSFFVSKASQLGEVYQTIAEELRAQYYLSYATTNSEWDGRWIKLRVEPEGRPMKVRARSGYFAVRNPSVAD